MNDLAIEQATAEDWPGIARLMQLTFHETLDQEYVDLERSVFEPDRSLLVRDRDAVVAHTVAFSRDLTVPGATVPAAHISMVGVAPTHRRQRLLTRLMHRQLAELTEPLAVLWASEGQIYPRFGYGMATRRLSFSAEARELRLPEPAEPGRLRLAAPAEVAAELRQVYESVRPDHPGWSTRDDRWWSYVLADLSSLRRGATERRAVLYEGPTGLDGYALWRVKGDWSTTGPAGEVSVGEVVARTPEAHLALYRFLFAIDLTRTVKCWLGDPDDPLLYAVNEPRRLGALLGDGQFVRIVDLPAALTARQYAAPVDVVLEVDDPVLSGNAGRWRLTADPGTASQPGKASCTRTDESPDLACGVTELGAAYLGGASLAALAGAGRVRELRTGALAAASTGFGWHRAPAGIEIF